MQAVTKLLAAVTPLLLTGLFVWLLLAGGLDLGGGEKDLFLTVPPLLWSLIYFLCYVALWSQGFARWRSAGLSAGVATSVTAIAWVVLFVVSWIVAP